MKKSAFFKNTTILMISNVISGILVFIFSIILSKEIGARGVGLYQLIIPMYTMLIYITGGGISVAISRIAAEKKAKGKLYELYCTVKVVCFVEIIWTVIIIGLVVFSAGFISKYLLSDSRTYYGILSFCPALIMLALSSTYKGAYYGVQRVIEPAFIEVIEKLGKIIIMYIIIKAVKGISLEFAVAGAILSLSAGEAISFLLFFVAFKGYKRKNPSKGKCDNDYQLAFNVFKVAIPVSMEGIISSVFGTLIVILIPKRLQHIGMSYEASLSLMGKLQGMAINIAYFPLMLTAAFNTLLIPSITEALATRNNRLLNHRINTAIGLASLIACLTSVIILSAPLKIGDYFYQDIVVGRILAVFAPSLPVIYIELISYSIINGLGKQTRVLVNSLIVQTLDIILLYIFVGIPSLNIYGYVINITLSSMLGIIINYRIIIKTTGLVLDLKLILLIPILCGAITYIFSANFIFKYLSIPYSIAIISLIYLGLYILANKHMRDTNII